MLFVFFVGGCRYGEGQDGRKDQLNPRKDGKKRDYCIADANEWTWGWSGKGGKGKEGKRKVMGTLGRGVKDNRKNLLVIKLQTDQIYIILYMYK